MFNNAFKRLAVWLAQPPPSTPLLPDPKPEAPPGKLSDAANKMLSWLKWGGLAGAVGALVVAGIMMAVGRRNRNNMAVEGAMSLPWVIGGVALILASASLVGWLVGGPQQ
jgi:hypothetical protein